MLSNISFFYSGVIFLILMNFFLMWNKLFFGFNIFMNMLDLTWMNFKYMYFIDSMSLFFIILSMFLLMLCIMLCWYWSYKLILYLFLMFLSIFCLINVFFVNDMLFLFIFFELVILPLFLLIGIWGSRDSKIYASYLLFMYTLLGSILALLGFLILYFNKGSLNFIYFNSSIFLEYYQLLLLILLFFGFSVKIPMMPMHIWLPEAHVEAPTVGSVILAGIMLKLGVYIYISLIMFLFSFFMNNILNIIFFIALLGIYMSSFSAMAQIDIKKMMAYSSIAHMNFAMIGLFCMNIISILGSFFMMFGHALVSSALFFSMGMLYDSFKTRIIYYYGGLVILMPIWVTLFFIFILGNFGFPGTMNFVGEFIIFLGSFFFNNFIIICMIYGLFLTLIYSLFLFNSLVYGGMKMEFMRFFSDLSSSEFFMVFMLMIFIIYFGLFPNLLFDYSFNSIFYYFFYN